MVLHPGSSLSSRKSFLSILATLFVAASPQAASQDLVITGVVDGPLSGGVPKAGTRTGQPQ